MRQIDDRMDLQDEECHEKQEPGEGDVTMETETLDKLYLELSQFTTARNAREIRAKEIAWKIISICSNTSHFQTIRKLAEGLEDTVE